MRRFGQNERDLAVDFGQPPPFVAAEVLEGCASTEEGRGPGREYFWTLPVGQRIECLLKAADWGNDGAIELNFRCQNPSCKQVMEVVLPVRELAQLQARVDGIEQAAFQHQGKRYSLRRPTGKDQLAWLAEGFVDESEAALAMARRLLVADANGQTPAVEARGEGWLETAGQVLEELDPLVDFSFGTVCPECGAENRFEVDLEALCLGRLQRAQRDLLEAVHTLAKHYHWSEAQIFAVPAWRRAHYLRLIAKEENR